MIYATPFDSQFSPRPFSRVWKPRLNPLGLEVDAPQSSDFTPLAPVMPAGLSPIHRASVHSAVPATLSAVQTMDHLSVGLAAMTMDTAEDVLLTPAEDGLLWALPFELDKLHTQDLSLDSALLTTKVSALFSYEVDGDDGLSQPRSDPLTDFSELLQASPSFAADPPNDPLLASSFSSMDLDPTVPDTPLLHVLDLYEEDGMLLTFLNCDGRLVPGHLPSVFHH